MKLTINSKDYDIKRFSDSIYVLGDTTSTESIEVILSDNTGDLETLKTDMSGGTGSLIITRVNGTQKEYSGYSLSNIRHQMYQDSDEITLQFSAN